MSILNGSFEEGPDQWLPVWARDRRRADRSHEVSASVGWLGVRLRTPATRRFPFPGALQHVHRDLGGNDRLAAAAVQPPSALAIGVRYV